MKNKTIFLLVFLMWTSCDNGTTDEEDTAAVPVAYAEAETRDLSGRRTITAPVVAYQRVYVTAQTSGRIEEIHFEEGDDVRAGDLLARLDTRRQEAQLRKARAALRETERHYQRNRKLFEDEVIPEAEYEAVARQLEEAEAEAGLWEVETELGRAHAPIDAVVTDRLIEVGTTVSENERLFTIEDHGMLVLRPGLSESDIIHLEKGREVALRFDVYPDDAFRGTIRRIFPTADAVTRLFTVEVEIDQESAPHKIYPGYLARLDFVTQRRDDAVAIPPESIWHEEDSAFVFVISNNGVSKRPVETGIRRDGWVEVLSGLESGEQVAAANLENLQDGAKVEVQGRFRRHGFRD